MMIKVSFPCYRLHMTITEEMLQTNTVYRKLPCLLSMPLTEQCLSVLSYDPLTDTSLHTTSFQKVNYSLTICNIKSGYERGAYNYIRLLLIDRIRLVHQVHKNLGTCLVNRLSHDLWTFLSMLPPWLLLTVFVLK